MASVAISHVTKHCPIETMKTCNAAALHEIKILRERVKVVNVLGVVSVP
jgi:hypothetical protein